LKSKEQWQKEIKVTAPIFDDAIEDNFKNWLERSDEDPSYTFNYEYTEDKVSEEFKNFT
jgi:hypothetical protein